MSLAIGMFGFIMALTFHNRFREAAQVASELSDLLESIGDPTLTVALLFASIYAKCEAGEMIEALRLADRLIDLADGDPTKGNLILGSPLSTAIAMRSHARMCLGIQGWQEDAATSIAMADPLDSTSYVFALLWKYVAAIPFGALLPDATAMGQTAEALRIAESSSDDFILGMGRLSRGLALVSGDGPQREAGLDLFTQAREAALTERFSLSALTIVDPEFAMEKARTGDLDGAIDMVRSVVDGAYDSGDMIWRGRATSVLVELLVRRGSVRRPGRSAGGDRPTGCRTHRSRLRAPRNPPAAFAGTARTGARRRKQLPELHGTPPCQGSGGRLRSTDDQRRRERQTMTLRFSEL